LNFSQPIATRVDELLSGVKAQLAIKLFGPDLAVLAEKGQEIEKVVQSIAGTRDVAMEQITGEAQLVVRPNRALLSRYGLAVGDVMAIVRDGAPISSATIAGAIEGSLKRLRTDYIDLYQFHWPNRGSYMFRKNWSYDPSGQDRGETLAHMEDALGALQREVDRGTICHFGLSNESAWGTAQWLALAEAGHGPRVASIQNEYSLLCRLYDTDLAELSVNEDVGLLAFSPLGTGLLSGKYQGGAVPEGSRKTLSPELGGRDSPRVYQAVEAYLEIARRHGIDPVQMALAWCRTRPFMASAIFGATRVDQLVHALGSVDVVLSDEVLGEIDLAHRAQPMPY